MNKNMSFPLNRLIILYCTEWTSLTTDLNFRLWSQHYYVAFTITFKNIYFQPPKMWGISFLLLKRTTGTKDSNGLAFREKYSRQQGPHEPGVFCTALEMGPHGPSEIGILATFCSNWELQKTYSFMT
jgi:hypothetical protein